MFTESAFFTTRAGAASLKANVRNILSGKRHPWRAGRLQVSLSLSIRSTGSGDCVVPEKVFSMFSVCGHEKICEGVDVHIEFVQNESIVCKLNSYDLINKCFVITLYSKRYAMARMFLCLSVVGAIAPCLFFVKFLNTSGMDIHLFFSHLFANGAVGGFSVDLLVSSIVFWVFIFYEKKTNPWLFVLVNIIVGLSCALPLYLYAREKMRSKDLEARVGRL